MSKYDRAIHTSRPNDPEAGGGAMLVDVYSVLDAFGVTDQALGHAIKKLLCAGQRGPKDTRQDLEEAIASIQRSITMTEQSLPFADGPFDLSPSLPGTAKPATAKAAASQGKPDKKRAKMDRRNERRKRQRAERAAARLSGSPAPAARAGGRKASVPARPPADLAPKAGPAKKPRASRQTPAA